MLDKISSAYFVDYPSISDHKLLIVYCKKTTTDESFFFFFYILFFNIIYFIFFFLIFFYFFFFFFFFFFFTKKNLLGGISINVLNLRKKFLIAINLIIQSEELGNGDLSSDSITEKFINATNSIAKDFTDYIFNRK